MITDPLKPGYYGATNQMLIKMHIRDMETLTDEWMDEAYEAEARGETGKAMYLMHMAQRVLT